MFSKPQACFQKSSDGFTLIELLVVLGVLSMLAAILVPAALNSKTRADEAQCINTLRTLAQAVLIYQGENDGYLPPNYAYSGGSPQEIWTITLRPYLGIEDLERYGSGTQTMSRLLACPLVGNAEKPAYWWESNYAAGVCFGRDGIRKKTAGRHAGATMMFIESTGKLRSVYPTPIPWDSLPFRHAGTVQVVFLDGHAEKRGSGEIPKSFDEVFWGARD